MPGGFTWADALAGYQAAGQAFFDIAGLVVGAVLLFGFGVGLALKLDDLIDGASASEAIRADARARYPDPEDWGADDIYAEGERDAA